MRFRRYLDILFVFILFTKTTFAQGNSCTDDSTAGPDDPHSFDKAFDADKGYGYVVYGDLYRFDCCGTVKRWDFSIGDNGKIELQIWRPVDKKGKIFKLIGFNEYTVTNKNRKSGFVTFDVPDKERLSTEEDDVIGWYAPGDSLIEYTDGTSYDGIWKVAHDDNLKVGDSVDFSGGLDQGSRTYGIQATLAPNTAPKFDPMPDKKISMDINVGTTIYTVKVDDADPADVADLKMEMTTKNDFFMFNTQTGDVIVQSTITVPVGGQTVTLDFKVTDHCGAEGTGSLQVQIDYVGDPNTTPTTTKAKTSKTSPKVKTTITDKTTTDVKTTKETKITETSVAPVATDKNTDKNDKTTAKPDLSTDQDPSNGTMSAMTGGSSVDAALIGGIVAGIVGLIIIIVVTVVCVVNKKAKVRPSGKDPEKANNASKDNAKNDAKDKPSPTDKKPPSDSKSTMNGKPHVKDKG
ncbi:uncharacterized protein LOC132744735 [Ruditapes philippinarum]|uniref:uncharacterized protein LOC132744735 n=1 Tax=Ruditapes philippinarum TaxID=129788 RepID=UPI00295C2AEC|nr:uncharacterized protein LOC132744735 [Ruditapes philippinarum]